MKNAVKDWSVFKLRFHKRYANPQDEYIHMLAFLDTQLVARNSNEKSADDLDGNADTPYWQTKRLNCFAQ